uniref:Putative secreted peptide of 4.99 kDa n=1 Tax=Ixodes ricinus TaxID=34613 RepID=V5H591_IXORI
MRALAVVLISVLLLECFYPAHCLSRHKNLHYDRRPPPCSKVCSTNNDCRPPCPRCDGGIWRAYQCKE